MVASLPYATSLTLRGPLPRDISLETAAAISAAAPRLERLCMDYFAAPSGVCAVLMASAASRLVSLSDEIAIGHWGTGQCTALAGCSRLTELRLGTCAFSYGRLRGRRRQTGVDRGGRAHGGGGAGALSHPSGCGAPCAQRACVW